MLAIWNFAHILTAAVYITWWGLKVPMEKSMMTSHFRIFCNRPPTWRQWRHMQTISCTYAFFLDRGLCILVRTLILLMRIGEVHWLRKKKYTNSLLNYVSSHTRTSRSAAVSHEGSLELSRKTTWDWTKWDQSETLILPWTLVIFSIK